MAELEKKHFKIDLQSFMNIFNFYEKCITDNLKFTFIKIKETLFP